MSEAISITLGVPNEPLDLSLVEHFSEALRGAYRELVKDRMGGEEADLRLLIRDVSKGSLNLILEPVSEDAGEALEGISQALIDDIEGLTRGEGRPTMSTASLIQYKNLARVVERAGGVKIRAEQSEVTLAQVDMSSVRAAMKERVYAGYQLVGRIESVNIHQKPYRCGVYSNVTRSRVECRFDEHMLDQILSLMEKGATASLLGEARFGPAGVTPTSLSVQETPTELSFDPDALLAFRRSADIIEDGEDAAAAVARIRRLNSHDGQS